MKQLTCEMCGSIDLIKQDGVFVCQSCGCKYSVEDAKKMMIEGAVEVTGTVKVDGIHDLETLIENANTFVNLGEFKKAEDLFDKVLNTYPKDYRGWYGKMQALTKNFNNNFSVLNSDSKKNEFFMSYKNAMTLSTDVDRKNLKERIKDYLLQVTDKIKKEKDNLEKTLTLKNKKITESCNEIESEYQKRCEELKRIDESNKGCAVIITTVIIILLIIHFFFANWWLLLTVPLGIAVAGGVLAGSGDTPISDDHIPTYVQINKLNNEKNEKIRLLRNEHNKKIQFEKVHCGELDALLKIYNELLHNISLI